MEINPVLYLAYDWVEVVSENPVILAYQESTKSRCIGLMYYTGKKITNQILEIDSLRIYNDIIYSESFDKHGTLYIKLYKIVSNQDNRFGFKVINISNIKHDDYKLDRVYNKCLVIYNDNSGYRIHPKKRQKLSDRGYLHIKRCKQYKCLFGVHFLSINTNNKRFLDERKVDILKLDGSPIKYDVIWKPQYKELYGIGISDLYSRGRDDLAIVNRNGKKVVEPSTLNDYIQL